MRDSKKKGQGPTTSGVDRSANASAKDPKSAQLKGVGGAVGNDTIQQRLNKGTATRDQMLQFLTQRLGTLLDISDGEKFSNQANPVGFCSINLSPTQDHVEGVGAPDCSRQAGGAAPGWHAAEVHFW